MASLKIPCFCPRCGGLLRSQSIVNKHAKLDMAERIKKQRRQTESETSVRLRNCSFNPNRYEIHYASTTPLYENADISLLEYIFIEMRKYVSHPLYSKSSVTEGLRNDKLFKLPKPNACPINFVQARKIVSDFLVELISYHVCPQDCVIYRDGLKEAKTCPICGTNRYQTSGKPRKSFKYFPLAPRIARIYQDENLANILQKHLERKDNGFLKDILDTDRWKNWFSEGGDFSNGDGIALSFCTDGVNPHKTVGLVYSMWPLMVSVLNFPIAFRKSVGGILLLGIIPGNGRHEANNLDPYMGIFIDELMVLSDCHIYYSQYMKAPVKIKVKLLQYVLDFPGISKLMKFPGTGAIRGCPWCTVEGKWCKPLNKTIYSNSTTHQTNDVRYEAELRLQYDNISSAAKKKKFSREYGVKGTHSLLKLPYHKSHEHIQPDPMHTIKDCIEHVIDWLIGKVPLEKLQSAEVFMNTEDEHDKNVDSMTKQEIDIANNRCESLEFPKECSGFKGLLFDNPKRTLVKTHGWTEYTKYNIWNYLIRDCLTERKRKTLIFFFWVLARLHSNDLEKKQISGLVADITTALKLLERDCPIWLGNITTHILIHLVEKIEDNGPLCASWMYPYERMNSYITRRLTNKSRMEECIMETMQILDWVLYTTYSKKFERIEDKSNNIAQGASRLLFSNGIMSDCDVKYNELSLDLRLRDDLDIDNQYGKFCSLLHRIEEDCEDVAFRVGDRIYCHDKDLYGEIKQLIIIDDNKYADVLFWSCYSTDHITQIDYVEVDGNRLYEAKTLNVLSPPLVTGKEESHVWFLGILKDKLPWIEEHLDSV